MVRDGGFNLTENKTNNENIEKKRSKKWLWITLSIIGVLIIGVAGYIFSVYKQVESTVGRMYEPLESDIQKKETVEKALEEKEPINILLLGVDERTYDRGRSDTMIFLSLNPNTDQILMFSIPRDTYVEIPGRGWDKINHAYAFGGLELSVETVEKFLDTTVHFYAWVNMDGFKDGVDAVGGVTVNNTFSFDSGGYQFDEGLIDLNGDAALAYVRMRYQDPRGDFGRAQRQRQVIQAAMNEAASFSSFTRIDDILQAVGNNVRTNMDMADMQDIFWNYRNTRRDIVMDEISGYGQYLDRVWYLMLTDEELGRIRDVVSQHVEASS